MVTYALKTGRLCDLQADLPADTDCPVGTERHIAMIIINIGGGEYWSGPYRIAGRKASICKLARILRDDGSAEHDVVLVLRDGKPSFTTARLSWWADRDVRETDSQPARFVKHQPFNREFNE